MNLYYAIIGDALHSVRKTDNKYSWKSLVFIFFTGFLLINIYALTGIIDFFTGYNIIKIFETEIVQCLPQALYRNYSGAIILLASCACIIYFSIFYKQKYIFIYRNYKHRKGKILITYLIVSWLLAMLLLFIY